MTDAPPPQYVKTSLHYRDGLWEVWEAAASPSPAGTVAAALWGARVPTRLRQPAPEFLGPWRRHERAWEERWRRTCAEARLLRHCWHPGLQRVYDALDDSASIIEAPQKPRLYGAGEAHGVGEQLLPLTRGLLSALSHLHDLARARGVSPPTALGVRAMGGVCWDALRPDEAPQLCPLEHSFDGPQEWASALSRLLGRWLALAERRESPDAAPLRAWLREWRGAQQTPASALASLELAFGRPERAALLDLDALAALERARAWIYEGRAEMLGELALLRPSLFGQGPLSDYAWEHLGERLAGALDRAQGPAVWERALLARLPQAHAALAARMGSLGERPAGSALALADLWIAHQPWPEPNQDS